MMRAFITPFIPLTVRGKHAWNIQMRRSCMNTRLVAPIMFAAVATILLLGAGCTRAPSAPPTAGPASAPTNVPPAAALPFVASAPTTPPPPDIPAVPPSPPSAADAVAPTPPPSAPRAIRVTAKRWEFVPAEIRVKKGERVVLEMTSADVEHGFNIPDLNINRTLTPGTTERIDLAPDKAGRYEFSCSVFCGRGHFGMRGTLIVE